MSPFKQKPSSSKNDPTRPILHTQHPTPADPSTKIRLSLLTTSLVDALGGPLEFQRRFSVPLVSSMLPNDNFGLPPGVWTDDTSMTLSLAHSLATYTPLDNYGQPSHSYRGGFDEKHQLAAYTQWYKLGLLSATGNCFDIGNTIREALSIYAKNYSTRQTSQRSIDDVLSQIKDRLGDEFTAGNGSLMRILPIGLAYWRDEQLAKEYARRSSRTTHPSPMCQEACEVWTGAIVRIIQASNSPHPSKFSKLDLLDYFSQFMYTNDTLREALTLGARISFQSGTTDDERETLYWKAHPVLGLIERTQALVPPLQGFSKPIPTEAELPSSGYVLHTLVAALYAFLATETFEEGAILAVNLGNDADTVGAVYAGLAGCWYAGKKDTEGGKSFWSHRVEEWKEKVVKRSLVEEIADELAMFSEKLGGDH